jgi:Serine/threonine protein kinase
VNNLREIQALKRLTPHPHIVNLEEVLYDQPSGRLAMVFELMDANLYDLISGKREHLDSELVRSLGYQLFLALQYMHGKGIFHRDIKPENVLIDASGKHLKVADLGSCRSVHARAPMTEYIATRWYRPPECLLTDGYYGPEMDIWGAGCVIFEITALFPLFPGADEVDQINRIHKVIGTPKESVLEKLRERGSSKINYNFQETKGVGLKHFIPHASSECISLLEKTMIYDYSERIDASAAVNHNYFSKLRTHDKSNKKEPSVSPKTLKEKEAKPISGISTKNQKSNPIRQNRIDHASGQKTVIRQKIKIRSLKKSHEESNKLVSRKSIAFSISFPKLFHEHNSSIHVFRENL